MVFFARDSISIVLSETEACRRQFGKELTSVTCCAVIDDAIELLVHGQGFGEQLS